MKYLSRVRSLRTSSIGYISEKSFITYVQVLSWIFRLEANSLHVLRDRISKLINKNGKLFTVTYLKESVRIYQHYLAGEPIHLSKGVPVGLSGGLPTIIPGKLRLEIKRNNRDVIKCVFTLLSVYRIMKVDGKLSLETITNPFKGTMASLHLPALRNSILQLLQIGLYSPKKLRSIELRYSGSAGANHKTATLGLFLDVAAWLQNTELLKDLKSFCELHPNGQEFYDMFFPEGLSLEIDESIHKRPLTLGRLSLKEEAAGKVRVFAIADLITQSVFGPLHEWIFDFLKRLPMDGTFDQKAPLERLQKKLLSGELEGETIYSYDLSAATDRLPSYIQRDILNCIFGEPYGTLWRSIMVNRDWLLKHDASSAQYVQSDVRIRYSIGQPMGALSSWGMLALTHHIIVQEAARRCGLHHFTDYALLGDDIVIANTLVAKLYHIIMTEELGMDISLHKSLISKNSFEFAKQLIRGEDNLSPLGPKNILLCLKSSGGIISLIVDMMSKGVTYDESSVEDLFKKVPTLSSKRTELVKWSILGPFGLVPTESGLTSSMKLVNSLTPVYINSLLSSIDDELHNEALLQHWDSAEKYTRAFTRLAMWDVGAPFTNRNQVLAYLQSIQSFICEKYLSEINTFNSNAPVRRFIFDGPIINSNYYREGFMKEIVKYITKKVNVDDETPSPFDPFDLSERVQLPWRSITPGEDFFSKVRAREEQKKRERNNLWMAR